jgi:hypothetical protein
MEYKVGAGSRTLTVDGRPIETKNAPARTRTTKAADDGLSAAQRAELEQIAAQVIGRREYERFQELEERAELLAIRDRVLGELEATYTEVDAPDDNVKDACKALLRAEAHRLGLGHETPRLKFFREETPREQTAAERWPADFADVDRFQAKRGLAGRYRDHDNTVWVHAGLDLDEALRTVVHEAAHALGADEQQARALEVYWAPRLPTVS